MLIDNLEYKIKNMINEKYKGKLLQFVLENEECEVIIDGGLRYIPSPFTYTLSYDCINYSNYNSIANEIFTIIDGLISELNNHTSNVTILIWNNKIKINESNLTFKISVFNY